MQSCESDRLDIFFPMHCPQCWVIERTKDESVNGLVSVGEKSQLCLPRIVRCATGDWKMVAWLTASRPHDLELRALESSIH